MVTVDEIVALALLLFAMGIVGVVRRRHLVVVFFCLQLMSGAGILALVGFNRMWAGRALAEGIAARVEGQGLAFLALGVGAVQLLVGIGLVLSLVRDRRSADIDEASLLGN